MDMERLAHRYRQAQRATVARSVLDVIAIVFLGCAFCFWGVAFWQLLAPPALLSLLSIQAVVLALVYALATPLLWSMLVPTTPAGQLLQKTQLRTVGFVFVVAAALYLSVQAEGMIEQWLKAQPGIAEAGWQQRLAISLSIAFILIPALAWVQLTPERWMQQIQQAHQVKKLEMMMRGEQAIIRATLLKGEQRALVGFVNLLPIEQEEHIETIRGLMLGINDQTRAIARLMDVSSGLERDMGGDEQIAAALDSVKSALLRSEIKIIPASPVLPPPQMRESHQDAAPVERETGREEAGREPPQRPAAPRSAPQREYAAEWERTWDTFRRGAWTVRQLAEALDMKERTARDRLNVWLEDGRAAAAESKGSYYLTEREAA